MLLLESFFDRWDEGAKSKEGVVEKPEKVEDEAEVDEFEAVEKYEKLESFSSISGAMASGSSMKDEDEIVELSDVALQMEIERGPRNIIVHTTKTFRESIAYRVSTSEVKLHFFNTIPHFVEGRKEARGGQGRWQDQDGEEARHALEGRPHHLKRYGSGDFAQRSRRHSRSGRRGLSR